MSNRIPIINNKHKICIVCEGYEEYEYFQKLIELRVWNDRYEVTPINARSNGNVMPYYADKYQNGTFELVLAFLDTDKTPYTQYNAILEKINTFHAKKHATDNVVIFGNPCTMRKLLYYTLKTVSLPHIKKEKMLK